MKVFSLLILFFGLAIQVEAQQKPVAKPVAKPPQKPLRITTSIKATYFVENKKVLVRWAPSNEEGWRLGNKYGYIFERRTITRDGKLLGGGMNGYFSYLVKRPDSLKEWLPVIDTNNNAAVMAQALYGESFELDLNKRATGGNGPSILSRAEENKQRYVFAMYAADNDFNVAGFAGLGFEDTTAKRNETYFYRIYPAASKLLVKSDTAMLVVSLKDSFPLPNAPELVAEGSNNSILLNWDIERTKGYYNSFIIQRSEDGGKNFENLTKDPYASFSEGSNPAMPNSIAYVDTAIVPQKKYQYRICGNTIFNHKGPWSAPAEGHSLALLEGVPGIRGIRIDEKGKAIVNWYYEDSVRKKVQHFQLTWSPVQEGPYTVVVDKVSSASSQQELPDNLTAGYLVVKAVSKEGISRTSFPYLYQPEDSLPPAAPIGVTATIDSTGKVVLKWLPNAEKDLWGYKVFRTLTPGAEPAILVDTVWKQNTFNDTLSLKMMNRRVYYSVSALDLRNNQSVLSKLVMVEKPDIIPPSPPVFKNYILKERSVFIEWINSTDDDVADNILFRKENNSTEWKKVFSTKNTGISQYTDTGVAADKKYNYKLVAKDSSGLESKMGQELTLTTLPLNNRSGIVKIDAEVDREKKLLYLHWKIAEKLQVKSFEVFKGDEKEPLSLYKVLDGKSIDMLDNELTVNTKYKYGVRAVFADGHFSDIIIKEVIY